MVDFRQALGGGYECLVSGADLLDRINVYPVADSDTGANLGISLAPLRDIATPADQLGRRLSRAALGNSGNIAVAFFREFIRADSFSELAERAADGRNEAWQAVREPRAGTMLTVFDHLVQALDADDLTPKTACSRISAHLREAVLATRKLLPELERAGVVDAGALGMFVFLDGFFNILAESRDFSCPVSEIFKGGLCIRDSFSTRPTGSHCVDAVLDFAGPAPDLKDKLAGLGESLVVVQDDLQLKVHIHTPDPENLQIELATLGRVVKWSAQDIDRQRDRHALVRPRPQALRIVTDAAGSLPRDLAAEHAITLLDSYIVSGDESGPETMFAPERIYSRLKNGLKVSTAQASDFERYQRYGALLGQFPAVLYLCVGSVFTGNYAAALAWKKKHDHDERFKVLDTGAASGRLAVIALATARYAAEVHGVDEVICFAGKAIAKAREYVFIDQLKYLAAGGRLAKTSGFFGDLLRLKPVVSPTGEGAVKVGVVRDRAGQLTFALERLGDELSPDFSGLVMLEYSDNREWLAAEVEPRLVALCPRAEIMLVPLSLTSGVHMGPGTWALAFLP